MGRWWSVVEWTQETTDRVTGLIRDEGLSARQVAIRVFGTDSARNAIIGKLHRLKLGFPRPLIMTDAAQRRRERDRARYAARKSSGGGRAPFVRTERPAPVRRPPSEAVLERRREIAKARKQLSSGKMSPGMRDLPVEDFIGITVVDLNQSSCRWPKGDPQDLDTFRYCGAIAVDGAPYCAHHCGLAYVRGAA